MKRFAVILSILALIVGCLGICMICLSSVRAPEDTEGWGALAQGGLGIILVGLALLLAASGAAIFIDRLCLLKKRKGNNKNEH